MQNLLSSPLLPALAVLALGIVLALSLPAVTFAEWINRKHRNYLRRKSFNRIKRS